jgi:radical SAM superfamily enzyme YgiQ (UPF0313 family)
MITPKTENELRRFFASGRYDVIAFGTLLHAYWIVKPLVEIIKQECPETLIVIGSYLATLIPEKLLSWTKVDIAVIGEGEDTFVEILEELLLGEDFRRVKGIVYRQAGRVVHSEERIPSVDLDKRKPPLWGLFDVESYINSSRNLKSHYFFKGIEAKRSFPILTTKGCPYRCTFCANSQYWKYNPYRRHSVKYVLSMVKALKEKFRIDYFRFVDELSFLRKEDLEFLVDAIIKEGVEALFEAVVRVDLLGRGDLNLARKMRRAGFVMMYYSLESANPKILKAMNKRISVEQFYEQKALLDKAGIFSGTNLVIGYPQETPESIAESFKACYDNDIMPSVGFLLPSPGSCMYDYAMKNGFIKNEEEYILGIGEQQFIKLNMTGIPDDVLYDLVLDHLKRIRDKLKMDIPDDHLICSVILK